MGSNLSFATEALALLADRAARHYLEIALRLRRAPSRIIVDAERLIVRSDGSEIAVGPDRTGVQVAVEATIGAADVVRLIDGTAMLETLLAEERLVVLADQDALLLIAEAVSIFLDGATRVRPFPPLFERYRDWVDTTP